MIAGSRSFVAIGQRAADAGPEALARLGAVRRRSPRSGAFAMISPDVLERVLGTRLQTRVAQSGGRLVIAVDGKAVSQANDIG